MQHYKIVVGNSVRVVEANPDTSVVMTVVDEMVAANGGGVPDIFKCDRDGNLEAPPTAPIPVAVSMSVGRSLSQNAPINTQAYSSWSHTIVDDTAKKRIEDLHAKIAADGIKIDASQQYFATGTRMAREGYATQARREQEFNKQMLLRDAISELSAKVVSESRRDISLSAKEIGDAISVEDSKLSVRGYLLTERAIRGIFARLESPAMSYVLGLQERIAADSVRGDADSELLAKDVDHLAETLFHECRRFGDVAFKLRAREEPRDVYAAVSPTYGIADADLVMEQIAEQMPTDARGSWSYDVENTSWELRASIWTPVPADEQAVGEPFEGFVSLSSRDNGTGRFNGGGGINILRCLNASTYTAGEAMSRVHRGKIRYDIRTMTTRALTAISTLCKAWGKARTTEVEIPSGITIEQAIPGFWRHLLKEGELVGVLAGRKEQNVASLTRAYFDERRDKNQIVKADFAQGFTKHIQSLPNERRRLGEQAIAEWIVKPSAMKCDLKVKEAA